MRVANIVVGAIAVLWFAVFLMGRDLVRGVYLQGPSIAPNAGQIDYYIAYPLIAVVLIILAGWIGNMWRKPLITLIPAILIGFGLLPFMLGYTGGM